LTKADELLYPGLILEEGFVVCSATGEGQLCYFVVEGFLAWNFALGVWSCKF
jgi:hypothetical protein